MDVITYPCLDWSSSLLLTGVLGVTSYNTRSVTNAYVVSAYEFQATENTQ